MIRVMISITDETDAERLSKDAFRRLSTPHCARIVQNTDSIWGAVLAHAIADICFLIAVFGGLGS